MRNLINVNKNSVVHNESIFNNIDEKIGYSEFLMRFYANESSKGIVDCFVVIDDSCELNGVGEREWGYRVEYVVVHKEGEKVKRTRVDIDDEDRVYHEEHLVLMIHDIVHLNSLDYGKIPNLPEKKVA